MKQRPDEALMLRTKEVMGRTEQTAMMERVVEQAAASEPAATYRILAAEKAIPREDVYEFDSLLFRFDARRLLEREGQLVLELMVNSEPADKAEQWTCRHVALEAGDRIGVRLSVPDAAGLRYRWGYSRQTGMRRVCARDVDDPRKFTEHSQYHVTWLNSEPQQPAALGNSDERQPTAAGEKFIELSERERRQIETIDLCESILDRLDAQLTASGEFLRWSIDRFSRESLDRLITAIGNAANIIIRRGDQEWIWGRRVRPAIEYPVALVQGNDVQECASIGISLESK
jgi:hypothetical protein